MCGIAGALWTDHAKRVDDDALRRMTEVLRHRGPDDEGAYSNETARRESGAAVPGVALGFRRLSIIDLACGRQPLANEDGTVWIVFNGEIYNYRQLRRRLEAAGHRFRTESDTETIVHLYEEEGLEFAAKLNGMFALALWDARLGRLVLARDRIGKKPLVYRLEPGRLAFASELKSLLQLDDIPRQVDPWAIDAYLTYQYVPYPRTIFRGISKLPPGHLAVWSGGELEVRDYWRPDFNLEEPRPQGDYAAELRQLMTSSVELRLQSEVPLGAFLSGGLDSTIVVGLMQRLAGRKVKTFSIGFPVKEYDETHYARLAAGRLGTEHEEFRVEPDALDVLPRLVWHFDEPFADSSAIPTWYVAEMTRRHVTVALTGDGGDELFVGYPRYRAVALAARFDCLPWPLRRLAASRLWQRIPVPARQKSRLRQLKRFAECLSQEPVLRYLDWIAIFNERRRAQLYSRDMVAQLGDEDPADFLRAAVARASSRDPVTAVSLADVVTYLSCDLMTKVDIASMAHSLECRAPFLDYRVVELAARMPLEEKYRQGQGKRILREAFADLLPDEILARGKMGFGVPLDHWFRGPLAGFAREVLLAPAAMSRGYFQPEVVRRLLDDHIAGRFDHAYRLWALVVLELWHRQWS